jgi:hypothetical protein
MKALVLAALFGLAASSAHAFPHITVTSSEVVQANPLRVKTTFDVDLVGPGGWCWIMVQSKGLWTPASGDTTHFFDCSPPSGWRCDRYPGYDVIEFGQEGLPCFGGGEHFAGFSITTNSLAPCVHFIFQTPLLGLDGSYHVDGCLAEDGPTPTRETSWGALKSTYR